MSQLAFALEAPRPPLSPRRLLEMVGAPPAVVEVLRFMDIAEEILAGEPLPPGGFAILRPSPVLHGGGDALYRAHVRELVARMRAGSDLRPGTDAECLRVMVETALVAPLTAQALPVAERLFRSVMPEKANVVFPTPAPERWAGQVDEDIAQLRRKTTQPDRRLS